MVTWTSYGQTSSTSNLGNSGASNGNDVYARRFNSNGAAAGNEFLVNTSTSGNQQYSKVAMDEAGDFTIVWESTRLRRQALPARRPVTASTPSATFAPA